MSVDNKITLCSVHDSTEYYRLIMAEKGSYAQARIAVEQKVRWTVCATCKRDPEVDIPCHCCGNVGYCTGR